MKLTKSRIGVSKFLLVAMISVLLAGCATKFQVKQPIPQIDTSSHHKPASGMAGIYYYQWKRGILGAGRDVSLTLDGKVLGKINTGEWLYFDVLPGTYVYNIGGPFSFEGEVVLQADKTYFFRGALNNLMDENLLITSESEIKEAFVNITSGRYEHGDID